MAGLFGGDPNYLGVNALQELRDEYVKLKVVIDENSAAMETLQKNYGSLDMEFRTLHTNYSSLLVTERSEVQRRTHTIIELNAEKDFLETKLNSINSEKHVQKNAGCINCDQLSDNGKTENKEENIEHDDDDIKCDR